MTRADLPAPSPDLVQAGAERALDLLRRNLSPRGILAATPGALAESRSYTRVFARDAGICVLAMAGSGDEALEQGAIASLDALVEGQAPNGQIPKFVGLTPAEADFWYVGCIDATLWWLIAVEHVRRCGGHAAALRRWRRPTARALQWLQAQEHQRFHLLQQNEASDWADIMPRSGFVLYTNALWYLVKLQYDLPHADLTHYHFNHLFHPYQADLPDYRRARLLRHYTRRGQRHRALYLSFVNLSFFGDEGDVFGNILAILCGLAGDAMAQQIVKALNAAGSALPYPINTVIQPIAPEHELWRGYMGRHRQNLPHQYHNGGIWPFIGGFWVLALRQLGQHAAARNALSRLAAANAVADWRFSEWFHGRTLQPCGMAGQSWNAAALLMARRAVDGCDTWP